MFHAKVFALLLVAGLSIQTPLKFTLFDDNMPDVSKKCMDEMTRDTSKVQQCSQELAKKYQTEISKTSDMEQLEKEICALIKDEQTQCVALVKGPCTDEEIKKIDDAMEKVIEQQLKQQADIDLDCSK